MPDTWMWMYTKLQRRMHTNTSTKRHIIQRQSYTHRNNSQLSFVPSTLLLPVCFFNLTVYISESKPVSITPTRAISMREKQIKCLMKANPGSWPHSVWICSEPADSHFQSGEFLSARLVFGWTYICCLCFKTYHYSIFAWVMPVSADLCLSTLSFSNLFYIAEEGNCNDRLCNAYIS